MAYKGRRWRAKAKSRRKRDARRLADRIRLLSGPVVRYRIVDGERVPLDPESPPPPQRAS